MTAAGLLAVATALALVLAAPAAAQEDDAGPWPQWLKDADHSRQADAGGLDDPGLAWAVDIGELVPDGEDEPYDTLRPWPSLSPAGDVLVTVTHPEDGGTLASEGRLLALARDTGQVRWEVAGVRTNCGQAVDGQGRIWVQRWEQDALEAIDATTGDLIDGTRLEDAFRCTRDQSHLQIGGTPEHLVLMGGRGGSELDGLAAYDISASSPQEAWRLSPDDDEFDGLLRDSQRQAQAVVADDAVFVAVVTEDEDEVERPELVEIDLDTGAVTDRVTIPVYLGEAEHDEPRAGDIQAVSFLRAGEMLILAVESSGDARGLLAGVDLTTGLDEVAWQVPTDEDGEFAQGPRKAQTLGDGVVVARDGAPGEPLRAYAPEDGEHRWTSEVRERRYRTTSTHGSRVADADGALYAHAHPDGLEVDDSVIAKTSPQGEGQWYITEARLEQELGLDTDDLWRNLDVSLLADDLLVVTEEAGEGTHIMALDDSGGLAEPWSEPVETGTVDATVVDAEAHDFIEGATVTVANQSATTDANGSATVTDVPDGTHTATASADGYSSESQEVTVTADETTEVTFHLTPDDSEPESACEDRAIPRAGFEDYRPNVHADAIDCAVYWGIAQGRSDTEYAPRMPVNRGQMATFVARLIEAGGGDLPAATDQGFTDLGPAEVHEDRINQLAAAGVVQGRTATEYAPTMRVTRAQMAAFLVNAYEYVADRQLPVGSSPFTDIDGDTQEANINKAFNAEFVHGATATTYEPAEPVLRDQMASFLTRVLEQFADDGNTLRRL